MIDLTVKTLDSQNHSFSVPDDITVKEFKEKIVGSVGIPSDKQRLIYCGRVLQDDKKLSDYDVNGKVIHLVQRTPPSARPASDSSSSSQTTTGQGGRGHGSQDGNSFLLGAFTIPSDVMDPNQVQQIVQQVVSGMGDVGRNATVMSRTSDDGFSVDVHINLGQSSFPSESQQRITHAQNMVTKANQTLNRLEQNQRQDSSQEGSRSSENSRDQQRRGSDSVEPMDVSSSTEPSSDSSTRQQRDIPSAPPPPPPPPPPTISVSSPMNGSHETLISGTGSLAQVARAAAAAAYAAAAEVAGVAAAAATRAAGLASSTASVEARASSDTDSSRSGPQGNSGSTPTTNRQPNASETPPQVPPRQVPRPGALANLLEEIVNLQTRFQPHLTEYQRLLREDPNFSGNTQQQTRAQQTFNGMSEILHYLSHAYHAISDIMIDMTQTPPRNLHSRTLILQQPAAIVQAASFPIAINGSRAQAAAAAAAAASSTASSQPTNANTETTTGNSTTTATTTSTQATSTQSTTVHTASSTESTSSTRTQTSSQTETPQLGRGPALPPRFPASLASLFASQNPVVLMELGPGSITIDGISATVVSGERSESNQGTTTGPRMPGMFLGQPPSQEFIQQLMQAVGQAAAQRTGTGNNGQSQARGNTDTNTTTSSQTRSTSRPMQPIPLGLPGFPGFGSGGASSFDPFLPCSSHHVQAATHRRTMNPPSAIRIPTTRSSSGTQNQDATTTPTQRLDNHLGSMVTSILCSLLGEGSSSSSGEASTSGQGTSQSNSQSSQSSSSSSASASASSDSRRRDAPVHRTTAVINTRVPNSSSQTTLADFLRNLPNSNHREGEDGRFVTDLIMNVASQMTVRDLLGVFFGFTEPLDRLQTQLQSFLNERLNRNGGNRDANLNAAIEEDFLEPIQEELEAIANVAELREGVDYVATMRNFLRSRLRTLILFITGFSGSNFGQQLFTQCQTAISEFIMLNNNCFQNGIRGIERVIQQRIVQIMSHTSVYTQQWLTSTCIAHVRNMMPNITVPENAILHYVVNRTSGEQSSRSSEAVETSASESSSFAKPADSLGKASEGRRSPLPEAEEFESASEMDDNEGSNDSGSHGFGGRNDAAGPNLNGRGGAAAVLSATGSQAVKMDVAIGSSRPQAAQDGSNNWQQEVSEEWIPIISQDIQHQRRQSVQRPISDAYISLMPTKRRKLMNNAKFQSAGDTTNILTSTLRQTIVDLGIQPLTSLDEVTCDVANNAELRDAYASHLRSTIRRRLETDRDFNFCPQKFPNAKEFFMDNDYK